MWYCAHCSHLNGEKALACSSCQKEKAEKLWPLWQRAFATEPDYKKYAAGKSKHERR